MIMAAKFQLVIDCADPEPLARFWVAALGYEFEPPPDGYGNWDDGVRVPGGPARSQVAAHRRAAASASTCHGCNGPDAC